MVDSDGVLTCKGIKNDVPSVSVGVQLLTSLSGPPGATVALMPPD